MGGRQSGRSGLDADLFLLSAYLPQPRYLSTFTLAAGIGFFHVP